MDFKENHERGRHQASARIFYLGYIGKLRQRDCKLKPD